MAYEETREFINYVQEKFSNLEMQAIFYNGPSVSFNNATDEMIEDITTNNFIEYISEDLNSTDKKEEKWGIQGQSLLDSENYSFGVKRLYEALQCCMWSNMQKQLPQAQHQAELVHQQHL